MTTEEKKIWLGRYRKAKHMEEELEMEIEAVESSYIMPARRMDGMPRGSEGNDLSNMAADIDDLIDKLKEQLSKRLEIYHEIVDAVEHSPISETQRAILRYRYILCMKWEEIATQVHVEESWMHRLRADAIEKLIIKQ